MELLNLETLAEHLKFKDSRSVRRWCEKNNVVIIKQGKQECVSQISFEEAFNKPLIINLKSKHGADWHDVYQMHMRGDLAALVNLQKDPTSIRKRYNPKSDLIQSYLKEYQDDPNTRSTSVKRSLKQPMSDTYYYYLEKFESIARRKSPATANSFKRKKPGG
jgi:hypothetical protein